jgi:polar amino acid transport system substrate-binding protein
VTGTNSGSCNSPVHLLLTIALVVMSCNLAALSVATAAGAVADVPRFVPPAAIPVDPPRPLSIRFVTSDDFPPFNFLDGSGRLTGYNVELARALCSRLQVPCTIQVRAFATLVDAVASNEADAILAGVKDTPGLEAFVAHTRPYLRLPARFVMRSDGAVANPVPETLAGRTVAVVAGTRYAAFLRDFFPDAVLEETGTLNEALQLLRDGSVDAVFAGGLPLVFWLQGPDGACCALAGGPYTEAAYFGDGMTIAVARNNEPLRQVLDDTLRALETDGVMADLYLRFFPAGLF